MVRSRACGVPRAKKIAKVLERVKGFYGRRKNCYRLAKPAARKADAMAYKGRKLKKRDMRRMWIQRINFAAREHNMSYSMFMNAIVKCYIELNRKVLSELAIHEPRTFKSLVDLAKLKMIEGDGLEDALNNLHISSPDLPQQELRPYQSTFVSSGDGRLVKETAV